MNGSASGLRAGVGVARAVWCALRTNSAGTHTHARTHTHHGALATPTTAIYAIDSVAQVQQPWAGAEVTSR